MSRDVDQRTRRSGRPDVRIASYSEVSMCGIALRQHHQPRLNGRVAGPEGGPVGWMGMSLSLECTSSRSRDRRVLLLECWKLWNGQIGPATQATSASVSSHWLSRTGSLPSAPSHVPPAAPPPVAAAAGGLTGVGGGADMVDDRRVRFERSRPRGAHFYWH